MTDVSMREVRPAPGGLRVGDLLGRGYEILSRDVRHYVALTLIANLPVLVLPGAAHGGDTPFAWFFVPFLFGLPLWALAQAFILYNVYQDLRGRPPHAGESLKLAFERFVPILLLAVLQAFAIGLAYLLLVLPGLFVTGLLLVAMPVCVVEQRGPITSMWRSADLTKGYRGPLVGLFVLLTVIEIVVQVIVAVVFGLAGGLAAAIAVWLWRAAFGAFFAVTIVVAYDRLRMVKEGMTAAPIGAELDAQLGL